SEPNNQKVMFVVFDDMSPVQSLDNFTKRPLFTDAKNLIGTQEIEKNPMVSTGKQIIGTGDFNYFVGHYETGGNADWPILVGSFAAKTPGKSILVIGQALSNDTPYDSKSTLFLVDQMAEEFTREGNRQRMGVAATPPAKPKTSEGGSETKTETVAFATDEQ